MSTKSKSFANNSQKMRTLSQFDRGPIPFNRFSESDRKESATLQLLVFALIEILFLKLTDNDSIKSNVLFYLLLDLLQQSKMLPISMILSAKSLKHQKFFQDRVQALQQCIDFALRIVKDKSTSQHPIVTSMLTNGLDKILFAPQPSTNLSIDIPQHDIQLKIPLPLPMNGTVAINGFGDVVIFRYVQDFYEIDKVGHGAFGSVFCAKNRLDDRMYAIKKIIFRKNTDRTRHQAQRALREVRVLASLSHPNIVQYHCAWLELVPAVVSTRRVVSSPIKKSRAQLKEHDSLDALITFEKQSLSSQKCENENDENGSPQKSSTTSTDGNEDENEISASDPPLGNHFNSKIQHLYNSIGHHASTSSSKLIYKSSKSHDETRSNDDFSNKKLVPLRTQNQYISTYAQPNYINSNIVLFIQMQLCDTTLRHWLRYRNDSIVENASHENSNAFYTLSDLGQRQCWQIYKQLLTSVQYLHSQGFIHRDIKPGNIFLAYDSADKSSVHVKLGDFGLATLLDIESPSDLSEHFKSDDSAGIGTALYSPPEQLNSHHCIATTKSDSYSLGIVLFELFNVFATEMQRNASISDLRINTKVEKQFAEFYPFESKIIEQLVSIECSKRPSAEQLLTTYAAHMKQSIEKQKNAKQKFIEVLQEKLRDRDRRIQQLELQLKKNRL